MAFCHQLFLHSTNIDWMTTKIVWANLCWCLICWTESDPWVPSSCGTYCTLRKGGGREITTKLREVNKEIPVNKKKSGRRCVVRNGFSAFEPTPDVQPCGPRASCSLTGEYCGTGCGETVGWDEAQLPVFWADTQMRGKRLPILSPPYQILSTHHSTQMIRSFFRSQRCPQTRARIRAWLSSARL